MVVYNPKLHKNQVLDRVMELMDALLTTINSGAFEQLTKLALDVADQITILDRKSQIELLPSFLQIMNNLKRNVYKTKKSQRTISTLDKLEDIDRILTDRLLQGVI